MEKEKEEGREKRKKEEAYRQTGKERLKNKEVKLQGGGGGSVGLK